MRNLLFLAVLMICAYSASGQVNTIKPTAFTEETNPNNSNFEFYSQKADSTRRASFNNTKKNMVPDVNTAAISFVPAPTGNTLNKMQFVHTAGDSIYYIDGYGDAFLLYDPIDTVITGSISGDTLYLNNLALLLTDYRQTIDTATLTGDSLYLSLSGDNEPAKIIDLSGYTDAITFTTGPLLSSSGDSIFLASDTTETDLNFTTQLSGSGRIRFLPVASTFQLALYADNNDIGMASLANSLSVADSVISITLLESGSNTGAMVITDSRTATEGVTYAADYSTDYVDRSLVDKGFVMGVGKADNVETEVTSKVTATLYSILPCNTSGGAFAVDVPAAPTAGDWFAISDSRGNANTFNITIDFTTAAVNFHGSSADYIMSVDYEFARFTYVDSTIGWIKTN